ncbi:MAG: phosphopantetheine-binding protein, partial [Proteobacteria bacterium]|nr:phosphopantetheine-binding protein [Pseudomonadota bacterium]
GLPGLSINFGTLSGGMADSAAVQSWTAREGLNPVSPEQAVEQMFRLISATSATPAESQPLVASIDFRKLLASRPAYDRKLLSSQIDVTTEAEADDHELAAMSQEALTQLIMNSWRNILRRKQLSPDDNFFDLGGDSLALIEGQLALNEALNIPVTVAEISDFPTASALAAYLKRSSRDNSRPSSLVARRNNSQATKLVVINSTREAKLLASLLPDSVDVCSLNLFRLSNYMAADDSEQMIPVLADLFTDDLCEEPIPENLFLFGFCQDALLSAEIVLRLEARGIHVDGLILLDALFRDDVTNTPRERWKTIREIGGLHYLAFYARRLPGAIRSRFRFGRAVPRYISSPVERQLFDRYIQEAFAREPAPLATFIHHLVSSQWRLKVTSAYSRIAATGYETLPVRGTHHGVWDSPFLQAMGEKIKRIVTAPRPRQPQVSAAASQAPDHIAGADRKTS